MSTASKALEDIVGLILYSEWHDARSVVKYTDVDYRVFSDAASFVLHLGLERRTSSLLNNLCQSCDRSCIASPYTRETYRYTPLLALLLTPNGWLHPSFGKYLFALCDLINGILIYQLLKTDILPLTLASTGTSEKKGADEHTSDAKEIERKATIYSAVHLLNPLVFSISTRGSSESVLSLFGRWDLSAVLLGLSTHWKIYPIIYGVGCLGCVNDYVRSIVNLKTLRFASISAGTFILLGVGCYAIWGYPFLYESYLYHLHRLDHRIISRHSSLSLTSFVPQMGLALGLGLLFGRRREDLVFTWFVQTVVFVVFNKVCTSQYFLCEAYKLEFLGENVFFGLWIRG
ncbi:glycosyltransferase family 50 protein [Pholiota molesta]|nr:glycosyltransferase family 50 protein [Pholiota molesta]